MPANDEFNEVYTISQSNYATLQLRYGERNRNNQKEYAGEPFQLGFSSLLSNLSQTTMAV